MSAKRCHRCGYWIRGLEACSCVEFDMMGEVRRQMNAALSDPHEEPRVAKAAQEPRQMRPTMKKPRNPQDATLRNVRALKKRVEALEHRLSNVERELAEMSELFPNCVVAVGSTPRGWPSR